MILLPRSTFRGVRPVRNPLDLSEGHLRHRHNLVPPRALKYGADWLIKSHVGDPQAKLSQESVAFRRKRTPCLKHVVQSLW